jgi:hypothetical protein
MVRKMMDYYIFLDFFWNKRQTRNYELRFESDSGYDYYNSLKLKINNLLIGFLILIFGSLISMIAFFIEKFS